jgi:hypothetical protein
MSDRTVERFLLAKDGVNQGDRALPALDPTGVALDGRSQSDLLRFIHSLSGQIKFFDSAGQVQGDWRAFLDYLAPNGTVLNEDDIKRLMTQHQDWPPHLALLMAFLRVFSYAQVDLNRLSAERLDFYYRDVLRLEKQQPKPDRIHVLFEPLKNAKPTLVKSGSLIDAGTTEGGNPIHYGLDSDIVVTKSRIARIQSSYAELNIGGKAKILRAEDATEVSDINSAWRPFGAAQQALSAGSPQMEEAATGFALASPELILAEGRRTITITIRLLSANGLISPTIKMASLVDIALSGETGWITADSITHVTLSPDDPLSLSESQENAYTLSVSIVLNTETQALAPISEALHQSPIDSLWPVLRMTVKKDAYLLEFLSQFSVKSVTIDVAVEGVANLVLQNDQTPLDPAGEVAPFSHTPHIGSSFYIGSAELFAKNLSRLSLNLSWKDAPRDLQSHYAGYDNDFIDSTVFQFRVDLLAGKQWLTVAPDRSVFNTTDPTRLNHIDIPEGFLQEAIASSAYIHKPGLDNVVRYDASVSQGFIRCVLTAPTTAGLGNQPVEAPFQAFGHTTFSTAYTRQVMLLAAQETATIPRPPYTPMLESLTLDYTATHSFTPSSSNAVDDFYILDVFGAAKVEGDIVPRLVPQHPGRGALYIGFEQTQAPLVASILFQAVEGSAPGEQLLSSEDLSWSYLVGNRWRGISTEDILENSTDGFQKAGLVRLLIGEDASLEHSLMASGMIWLRAAVTYPEGAASLIDVQAQAASATLHIDESQVDAYENHLSSPLPADSVTGLVRRLSAIKGVTQPYPSFGGRPRESDSAYYRRNHERLRHRARSVTGWDFERLLLEQYHDVYKVKCLPHTDLNNKLSPGSIKIVIVPDWRQRPSGNPLQPRANQAALLEINRTLTRYSNGFSELHVTNPSYETLLVDSKVGFRKGFDPGYHAALLSNELQRFLSPWAFDEGKDIVFGGNLHSSEILAFIEGREYVDYVADFALYHRYTGSPPNGIGDLQIGVDFTIGDTPEAAIGQGGDAKTIGVDFVVGVPVEVASATRPDAIIVSHDNHRIRSIQADESICQGTQAIGIGQMIIGLDFVPVS